jgi:NAD(P)-dependent dehydrogenase (short-subunit alcohol dehydrogenase family)
MERRRTAVDLGFADAAAVVTGGSKGMGRAVAEILATDGARVAVMARGRGALDDTVASLQALGSPDAVGISVDMTDPASIASGFREVGGRWGSNGGGLLVWVRVRSRVCFALPSLWH